MSIEDLCEDEGNITTEVPLQSTRKQRIIRHFVIVTAGTVYNTIQHNCH